MSAVTGLSVVTAAFEVLAIYQPGDPVDGGQAESARGFLNRMLGSWAQQSLTIPAITRSVTVLTAAKGGPSNPYTIGTGANISVARPPNQESVLGATFYLTSVTPVNEIPLDLVTDGAYASLTTKELPGTQPSLLWYNPTFTTSGWGSIQLYPVPDNALNSLVLYLKLPLAAFADLTTTYYLPDGMEDTIVSNLAKRMAGPWGAVIDQELKDQADDSLRVFKRSNLKFSDLPNYFTQGWGWYDIEAGNY